MSEEHVASSFPLITVDLVRAAFRSFKGLKAPGPDQIQPMLMHHLPDSTIERIILIYKACLLLSFTPARWCYAQVIFIPKPGKPS